jgi:hypothetical protein
MWAKLQTGKKALLDEIKSECGDITEKFVSLAKVRFYNVFCHY